MHGAGEKLALSLPGGSSATTPTMCMGVLDPTLRYFAANDGGLLSLLTVQILYYPPGGGVITLPLGVNVGGKSWAPSLPTVVAANLLGRAQRRRRAGGVPLHADRARREVADRRRLRRSPRQPLGG